MHHQQAVCARPREDVSHLVMSQNQSPLQTSRNIPEAPGSCEMSAPLGNTEGEQEQLRGAALYTPHLLFCDLILNRAARLILHSRVITTILILLEEMNIALIIVT